MQEPIEPNLPPAVDQNIGPRQLFALRSRVLTIEQFAWKGYLDAFTDTILEVVGLPDHLDPKSEMAAEAARCADAVMEERQKRFPRPDYVNQVLRTNH